MKDEAVDSGPAEAVKTENALAPKTTPKKKSQTLKQPVEVEAMDDDDDDDESGSSYDSQEEHEDGS